MHIIPDRTLPVRWSPRPLRAITRTRLWRQAADRAFAVAVVAAVAVLLRLSDALHALAPLTLSTWK